MNRTITRSLLIALGASIINFQAFSSGFTKQAKKMQATAQAMADKAQEKTQRLTQQMEREMTNQADKAAYPLHAAVYDNNLQKVKDLIAGGADVNAKYKGDRSPLFFAHTPEIVLYLLNHGANPNATANEMSVFQRILKNGDTATLDVVSLFIAKGVDVNAELEGDYTNLMLAVGKAVYRNEPKIVELLLKAGARVNDIYRGSSNASTYETVLDQVENSEKRRPELNHAAVKKLLIDAGAKKATDLP